MGRLGAWLRNYGASADPRTALANMVALLVASSQPFYPLYLRWTVSETVWPSVVTALSFPFFLAVPALARRNALAGRALLVVAGIGNTVVCAKAFGTASGVEVFLVPCIALALLLFRPSERLVSWSLAAAGFAAYLLLRERYGAPFHVYEPSEYVALQRLNFMSAAGLIAVVAHRVVAMLSQAEPVETSTGVRAYGVGPRTHEE